ncbi:hypothetical protein SAMN05421846_10883 [Chryseobacterium taeanense]|uniref:Uncharacterized protein n=1 Tax=Chryseobacterium taeanense TaxID=311334 RepID=A0A1G8KX87_9FLAO|nr:hypothetical protein [Chryseobacterium taeanense]SDI47520.1 hypothetical protein SAMN05421846_10883 [Chryseobacterium taeanense]
MSKKKLLIIEVFEQAKRESDKTSKNGLAMYLKVHLETFKLFLDEKTFSRYHDSFVTGIKKEVNPDKDTLDKLSQYVGYKNFTDFSNTFIKKDEEAHFTEIKVNVDGNELSSPKPGTDVYINITNTNKSTISPVKDFMVKNKMGILEMTFVLLLATGGVVFSNPKTTNPLGITSVWNSPATDKPFMYWDKDRYMATDSSYLGPQIEVVPMDKENFTYLKKITRPDTLTVDDKVWYDKTNNQVEFFTSFGKHPENGKTLKEATEHIIETYAGR